MYFSNSEGILRFSDGGWVYVVAHSFHANSKIGDVVLAIDHNGTLYESAGHVCSQVMIEPPSRSGIKTLADFLSSTCGPQKAPWRRLEE